MNEFESPSLMDLDRLVDGELSDAERRDVLAALEREDCSETCGWRRLALCFVEAQSLRQDLKTISTQAQRVCRNTTPTVDTAATPVEVTHRRHAHATSASASRIVVAAICCLVAFGLGRNSINTPTEIVATVPGSVRPEIVPPDRQTFAGPDATSDPDTQLMAMAAADEAEVQQTMRLVLDDLAGSLPQAVDVPVINNSNWDPLTFLEGPPSIPPVVQQELLRQGRVVHEERQLYPVLLSDGRRGVVPISDVTVINAGAAIFQ